MDPDPIRLVSLLEDGHVKIQREERSVTCDDKSRDLRETAASQETLKAARACRSLEEAKKNSLLVSEEPDPADTSI